MQSICRDYKLTYTDEGRPTCKFYGDGGACRRQDKFMCWDYLYFYEGRKYLQEMDLEKHNWRIGK